MVVYNILIVGSGGREHCIAKNLLRTHNGDEKINLLCFGAHNNPGLSELCVKMYVGNNKDSLNCFLSELDEVLYPTMAIIGPEAYINDGYTELLELKDISVIAPDRDYAQIETSKIFARNYISSLGLDMFQPKYKYFNSNSLDLSTEYAYKELNGNFVVKNDGLAGGKGVKISQEHIKDYNDFKVFIESINGGYVIEEKLEGEEFSLISFSDGINLTHTPIVRDYKRAYDGDIGPNTGGMGSISGLEGGLDYLNENDILTAQTINVKTVRNMSKLFPNNQRLYKGVIYGSFMKTKDGIKIIEFNCRFGDPEVLNILTNMKSSLLNVFLDIKNQSLVHDIEFYNRYSVCKYLVPKGYPDNSVGGYDIYFTKPEFYDYKNHNIPLYFASVEYSNNHLLNLKSRCIAYVGTGNTLMEAYLDCENNIVNIVGNMRYRKDIGETEDSKNLLNDAFDIIDVNYLSSDIPLNVVLKHNGMIICGREILVKPGKITVYKLNKGGFFGTKDVKVNINNRSTDKYSESGVNITEGGLVVEGLKKLMKNNNIGNFGGLFPLNKFGLDISLVSSIDGVGTKVILADKHNGAKGLYNCGKDLVYHGINDILVMGAKPLFFLDYYGCQKLISTETIEFVKGIVDACNEYSMELVGGETAEMNTIYNNNMKDLVGVAIGYVSPNDLITGDKIENGNYVYAFPSTGPHTNGYSLIRKILDFDDKDLIDWCLQNHRCYFNEIERVRKVSRITGLCHITGGGFYENLERVLNKNKNKLKLEYDIIGNMPTQFKKLQEYGNVSNEEMMRVFNCGIGFVFIGDKLIHNIDDSFYIGQIISI